MSRRRPLLVVDDEPSNLALLRQILGQDHALVYARSGHEALAMAARHRPAVVLLDVRLPDLEGYEVCRRIKADPATADSSVIFVTALSSEADEVAGFEAGGVDFIVKPVSAPIVRARVATHLQLVRSEALERSYRASLEMLGRAGEYNDIDTGVHVSRMAEYCGALARAAGWDEDDATLLELAAPLHDVGKIGVPDAILKKPDGLTPGEWAVMQSHCQLGHDILSRSHARVFRLAAEVALSHHEHWDGSGYPRGLAGEAIPQSGRIVAIADVFDALSMRRTYKEAWPLERIVEALRNGAGSHFDPGLVALFLDRIDGMLAIQARWAAREQLARPLGLEAGDTVF